MKKKDVWNWAYRRKDEKPLPVWARVLLALFLLGLCAFIWWNNPGMFG